MAATWTSESQTPLRLGLALGGGVSRGPAHLGVFRALRAAGVPVACVSGASAGAIAGAIYCSGAPLHKVEALTATFNWWRIARPVWPRRGLLDFTRLEGWLTSLIGDVQFGDLAVPLAVVATNLETGQAVTLREGPVARAVHASCAVPGLVAPVEWNGCWLGDGAVSSNLPVQAARALGADRVVAVDLFQPKLRTRWGPLGFAVAALEHLVRHSGGGPAAADVLICPELAGASYFRFNQRERLVTLGAAATEAALPAIRAMLAQPMPH